MLYQSLAAHYFPFLLICMAHTHWVTLVTALHQKISSVVKRESEDKKCIKVKNKIYHLFSSKMRQNPKNYLDWKLLIF